MAGIVVAMPRTEDARRIGDMIRRSGISGEIVLCCRGVEILRLVQERDIGIVVCVMRYSDMMYSDIAGYLPTYVTMILLTSKTPVSYANGNILPLMMPLKSSELIGMIRQVMPSAYTPRKKRKPVRSPEDQAVIDKAKERLMETRKMTEPDAFRYLQKSSMDQGRSLLESAQMVLLLDGKC